MDYNYGQRVIYIDLLKILAVFLVIVNHTNSSVFVSLQPSITWFSSLVYFFVSKVAVPVFIMATGVLMLGNVSSYSKSYSRIKRIFVVFIIFSLFYYFYKNEVPDTLMGFLKIIKDLIQAPATNALWYLYLYLALLLVMPYLQRLSSTFNKVDVAIFIALCLLLPSSIDIIKNITGISFFNAFDLTLFCYPVGFLFSGHYIDKYVKCDGRGAFLSVLIFLMAVIFSVLITYYKYVENPLNPDLYLYWSNIYLPNIVIETLCVFYFVKYVSRFEVINNHASLLSAVSVCTFGIYLFSDFCIYITLPFYNDLMKLNHPLLSNLLWQVFIFITCFILVYILRKNKVIMFYL
ncbi:acyltransferase family protein [Citrobacter freundii]|nr:acyltransferase family protein [Citrobacter freundii]